MKRNRIFEAAGFLGSSGHGHPACRRKRLTQWSWRPSGRLDQPTNVVYTFRTEHMSGRALKDSGTGEQLHRAELHIVEQAMDLSISLLGTWLAAFKDWHVRETRHLKLTKEMRERRAVEVANKLMGQMEGDESGLFNDSIMSSTRRTALLSANPSSILAQKLLSTLHRASAETGRIHGAADRQYVRLCPDQLG